MSIVMQLNPFEFFPDKNGTALDEGFIWIGQPNKDPRAYPASVYFDAALTIPAALPLRTAAGYVVRGGTPTYLYISGNYSVLVQDKTGSQVYYVADFLLNGTGNAISGADLANTTDPLKGVGLVGGAARVVKTIAEMVALPSGGSETVFALGYYVPGDGGGGAYNRNLTSTKTPDGGRYFAAIGGGRWELCQAIPASLRQYGCKGDGVTDDTAGYLSCVLSGLSFHVPKGDFNVSPIGPSAVYPGPIGSLRTSAAVMSTGQCITGDGELARLIWGSTTIQAFLLLRQGVGVRISGVSFVGGHSGLIVDPISDGSVDSTYIENCSFDGQALAVLGGRQLALDPASKSHTNFNVLNCKFKNMPEHSVLTSNCNRGQIHGNDFRDSVGGFCVDLSQGTRGVTVHNNTGDNVLHFNKIESSKPDGGDQDKSVSTSCSVTGNIITRCTGYGTLINSHTERLFVHGNTYQGSVGVAIQIDAVTGFAHDGQVIIANNTVRTGIGGIALKGANLGQGVLPPLVVGNNFYGSTAAVDWRLSQGKLINNNMFSSDGNVFNIGGAGSPNLNGVVISGNKLQGASGIVSQNDANVWTRTRIENNEFTVTTFAVYAPGQAGMEIFKFSGNTIHYAAATANHAVQLSKLSGAQICNNQINMPSASTGQGVYVFTAALKSIISSNTSTRPFTVVGGDASTTANTINNIFDVAYAA